MVNQELQKRVEAALQRGDIHAIGGSVYDSDMNYLCITSDLAELRWTLPFERVDTGGSPTWRLRGKQREG